MNALKILTQGIVQGVGFRPYVYRLAKDLNLNGSVRNLGNVVEIIVEGKKTQEFVRRLPEELPPIAKINSIEVEEISESNYTDFEII
ncbi:MAG: acylphosphatase, partial [Methanobrevibacter sp.]|nr:acylphosphatase [Methanobrevibacter sp.]